MRAERFTQAFRFEAMSARSFIRLVLGAIAFAGSLGAAARWVNAHPTKAEVDSVYVRRDTFAIYQQGHNAIHMRDSLIQAAVQARSDSMLSALVRACRRRGECP